MEKLGNYLRKEREARNCSLEEISSATKIRKGILVAIENDDYTLLPPPVFVKGFLKAYAIYLGLDTVEVMKRYQEITGKCDDEEEEEKRRHDWSFLQVPVGITAAGIVLAMIFYLFALRPSSTIKKGEEVASSPVPVVTEKKSVEMPVESVLVPDKGVKEQTPAVASQPGIGTAIAEGGEAKRLNLLCKVKERTWMRIIADEMQPSEVMLQAGETYEVKADQVIKLKIGNAGGVDLFLNGKLLPSQGKSGEVVNLTLSENDLTQQVTR